MSLSDIQAIKALKLAKQNSKYIGELFNPFTLTIGYILNGSGLTASASYGTSDFIPVTPNVQYIATDVRFIGQYDSNKNFIGGTNFSYSPSRQNLMFRANSGASYVRISSLLTNMQSGNYHVIAVKNPSKWVAKIWAALGDSITQNNNWQPYVQDVLGVVHYNYGQAGTTVADTTGSNTTAMCRDERINAMTSLANLITFMGGTNDWANNIALGSITDTATNTFYGALNTMVKKIVTKFPDRRFVMMATPYGKYPNRAGFSDTYGLKNNLGLTTLDYGKAVIDVARLWGIPVIDIGGKAGWNDVNISTFCNTESDGALIHPNDTGARRVAELLNGELTRLEPIA